MAQTLALLMALAAASGPPAHVHDEAHDGLRKIARKWQGEARLLERLGPEPEYPGWDKPAGAVALFMGQPVNPAAQGKNPGVPPAPTNRFPLSASWRFQHIEDGEDPARRLGWSFRLPGN